MRLVSILWSALIGIIVAAGYFISLFSDYLWYGSVGYPQVFSTIVMGSVVTGGISAVSSFAILFSSLSVARLRSGKKKRHDSFLTWAAVLLALLTGLSFSDWSVWQRFSNSASFGVAEPVFGQDVGFYVFSLPLYWFVTSFLIITVSLSIVLALVSYAVNISAKKKSLDDDMPELGFSPVSFFISMPALRKAFVPHASVLGGILMICISAAASLMQYGILYSQGGAVYGAGYTDLAVTVNVLYLTSIMSFLLGLVFFINLRIGRARLLLEGGAVLLGVVVIGTAASGITQAFIVAPDEFNVESQYLSRNIDFTLKAYGLESVEEREFPVSYDLSFSDLKDNAGTIENVRLWDWRPLSKTYNQLQLFRTYYEFKDIDIDRYEIDGRLTQVMLSGREMNSEELPGNARTWVNEHLVYTHGYGLVMNPSKTVSDEGLPHFIIKDIPPKAEEPALAVERPEIYFGEDTANYVIVRTTTEELDYPSGDQNIYTRFEGDAGIPLSDFTSKLAFAAKLGSPELLVSNSLTPESRLLLYRDIGTRLSKLAPFISWDSDPYIVVSEGRLYWIIDGYTTTDSYPYSEAVMTGNIGRFNYVRNSVKAVVNAYDGRTTFYVADFQDPIITAYGNIFPGMFVSIEDMPPGIRQHVRYPEDLFMVQSAVYSIYHMKDARVFYNKEDVWIIPDEIYQESRQRINPYYVILQLPGEENESFLMMVPFTPRGKENLIGWMAAVCDPGQYGKKLVFQFSKQELVYGPMQIEARIDQDTDISQAFTLWSQAGSRVIRGNTLVIPIKNSVLYIEPVYLEATETGTLPELKRVIVAYGNRLTMQPTLEEALQVIFSGTDSGGDGETGTAEEVILRIAALYKSAQDALKSNDLGAYQEYVDEIGRLVESYE